MELLKQFLIAVLNCAKASGLGMNWQPTQSVSAPAACLALPRLSLYPPSITHHLTKASMYIDVC